MNDLSLFTNKVMIRLPRCTIPYDFNCGRLLSNVENLPHKCWSTDSHGRLLIKWNNKLLLQRESGLMYGLIRRDLLQVDVVHQVSPTEIALWSEMI